MINKAILKEYIAKYGEVQAIKDIASILQDLSQEWMQDDNKPIGYAFSNAANLMGEAAFTLEAAEATYIKSQSIENFNELEKQKVVEEFNNLVLFFHQLSIKDVKNLYFKNKKEFLSKAKRLEFLSRLLEKNDKKE